MANLSPQDIKTLEHTRQRLSQLSNSLASLQQQIMTSDPLPAWSSFQSLSQIISQNLTAVSQHLSTHSTLLSSLAAYPLPTYPGREQESLLNQLLRKKLEPHVEDWVEEGRSVGEEVRSREGIATVTGLWEWAGLCANEQARRHEWGGEFTLEEREAGVENVITGLRGVLEESSDEEDEEEEEDGNGTVEGGIGEGKGQEEKTPMAIEDVLRVLVRGEEVKR